MYLKLQYDTGLRLQVKIKFQTEKTPLFLSALKIRLTPDLSKGEGVLPSPLLWRGFR
jgi:hypothetical protein